MTTTLNGVSLMTINVIGGVIGAATTYCKTQLDRIKRFINEAARPNREAFA
ncbi:hypothetical protein [Rosenbergiella epipactidis]|uniref:hypothetical protein n=1 Tax=Rosenbergiella epipactidis TaxID=1544694 RepID=UPI001F4FD5F1|nr:hypothetical protein [Rosenbergiella epipactidis]